MSLELCPSEWATTKFTDALDVQGGTQPPKSQFISEPKEGYIRLLQIRDFGERPVPTYIPDTSTLKKCRLDEVLIGRYGASLGRICSGMEGAYNVALAKVVMPSQVATKFIRYYLLSELFQQPLRLLSRSAQNGFNKEDLASFDFALPPLAEQKQIAAKLDELLAQVDTIKARLDAIPKILKRFRQSVLAAAVSGRLTEEWRKSSHISPPKAMAIDEVSELVTKGASPNWQGINYVEDSSQTLFVTSENVGVMNLLLSTKKYVEDAFNEKQKRSVLKRGDVLTNIVGASIGRAAIWSRDDKANTNQAVCLIRLKAHLCKPDYLSYFLNSPEGISALLGNTVDVARANVSLSSIKNLEILIPEIEEQTEIVRRVEQLLAFADQIETRVKDAQSRVNHLTQSILAKAFRGELTADWRAQNPDLISGENSAAALLARIRAERERQVRGGRKGRKPAKA